MWSSTGDQEISRRSKLPHLDNASELQIGYTTNTVCEMTLFFIQIKTIHKITPVISY